jgi:hypothetical protein
MILIQTIHLIHASSFLTLAVGGSQKEDIMNCVAYKSVECEDAALEQQDRIRKLKPFAVEKSQVRPHDEVARRVAEILEFELAQGSMPA